MVILKALLVVAVWYGLCRLVAALFPGLREPECTIYLDHPDGPHDLGL